MSLIKILSKLPLDLGQGKFKHKTKAKLIAFKYIPKHVNRKSALDLGCGDGYWSEKLKSLGYHTISVDMKRSYPNIDSDKPYQDMIPINLNQKLSFPDASFDLIWCSEVIEHLENYQQTIKEIQRLLKPGGIYIITTPNSFFWLHYFLKLFGLSSKDWQNPGHKNFFHISDIQKLFPSAKIYGYFPYTIVKFKINNFINLLSPNFIIIGIK